MGGTFIQGRPVVIGTYIGTHAPTLPGGGNVPIEQQQAVVNSSCTVLLAYLDELALDQIIFAPTM
jgi:hypothetical protein